MATLLRLPKSAHEWTQNELYAYNIHIDYEDEFQFFELGEDVPEQEIDGSFLAAIDPQAALAFEPPVGQDIINLLYEMEDAMDNTGRANEASVYVFAIDLLNHIQYRQILPRIDG
jgi:hypothetical protein